MTTSGRFTIEGTPSSPPGYDVTGDEVLTLQLEDQPALDVLSCVYSEYGSSFSAPALVFSNSGVASPPGGVVTVTVPPNDPAGYSWGLKATSVVEIDGKTKTVVTKRVLAMRVSPNGTRKLVVREQGEYDADDGWVQAFNEVSETAGSTTGGGGGGASISLGSVSVVCGATDITATTTLAGKLAVLFGPASAKIEANTNGTQAQVKLYGTSGITGATLLCSATATSLAAAGTLALSCVSDMTVSCFGAMSIQTTTPTTDVAPSVIELKSASAYASAATNKTGANIRINVGRGATPGTDASGAVHFGIGDAVAGLVAGGIVVGSGAVSGALPYTTELLRIRQYAASVGQLYFATAGNITANNGALELYAGNGALFIGAPTGQSITLGIGSTASKHVIDVSGTSSQRKVYGTANTLGYTETVNAAGATCVAAGTLGVSCTGALTVTGSTDLNLNATTGAIYIACNGNMRNTVGGALVNNVYGRSCEWNDQGGTERRATLRWDAAVVMASAGTPSTQMAISLATSGTDITIRGRHSVKPTGGGAAQITVFEVSYENVGGTVSVVGTATITSSGATLGTFSISHVGTTINLVFTPTLATSYTGKATELDMRF